MGWQSGYNSNDAASTPANTGAVSQGHTNTVNTQSGSNSTSATITPKDPKRGRD